MLPLLTIDFETFYSQKFSLKKLTTEEYIRSRRFEVIGVGVKRDAEPTTWFTGPNTKVRDFLHGFDWENSAMLAHNAAFDAAILNWRYGLSPARILDTMSMARAIHGSEISAALASLATHYQLGAKGTEVHDALGKRRVDFGPEELARYGEYCCNDVELTYELLQKLIPNVPTVEMRLIDLTIRMFTEPVFRTDEALLQQNLDEIREIKQKVLEETGLDKETLMSNPKFAAALQSLGVTPPSKISKTTNKSTFAFSKSDEDFKALLESPDTKVQALVSARLKIKSTIEETRTARFLDIGKRGAVPIPLRYYAAHTGRWGGDDKVNFQNLPRGSALKNSLVAPPGYRVIDSDSSQIEARTLAWLAGQDDLVDAFKNKEDVYKIMASKIYNKPEKDISKDQRFVGKTTILGCIAKGTPVLCQRGWVPIERIKLSDRVWDGEEWVCHQGLLKKGLKETLSICGLWLTPDHRMLCGTQWLEAQSVAADGNTLSLALGTGAANLPSQATYPGSGWVCLRSLFNVAVVHPNTLWTNKTLKTLKAHVATFAPRSPLPKLVSYIGGMRMFYPATSSVSGFSTAYQPLFLGVTSKPARRSLTTEVEGYSYTKHGEVIAQNFSSTYRRWMDGITRIWKWIGSTLTETTNRVTSVLLQEAKTWQTGAKLKFSRRSLMTYDLAYAGPRNRYTVATDAGPVIVHNCGYGMGAVRFKAQLATFGVTIDDKEAEGIIRTYRETYQHIAKLWSRTDKVLSFLLANKSTSFGRNSLIEADPKKGLKLPNGLYIRYPNLREEDQEVVYDAKRGGGTTKLYGAKVIENICQALARIVIGEQMLMISRRYKIAMTVHDAICCVVPEDEEQEAIAFVEECMRTPPKWAEGLPLDCEAGSGRSYGEC